MSVADLAVHPDTAKAVQTVAQRQVHALLITGQNGLGKYTLAKTIVAAKLKTSVGRVTAHPYVRVIKPDEKQTISIASIRELQQFLRLRTTGRQTVRRIIIIDHADRLTIEAQNAFLKILEEPPADTVLILTAQYVRALLPTIRSRVQVLPVQAPAQEMLLKYFESQSHDKATVKQAYFLSGGLPGLMHGLLNEADHPLAKGVQKAKNLLAQSAFERLATIDELAKHKDDIINTIDALMRIAHIGLQQAATKQSAPHIARWHHIQKQAHGARAALQDNANAKLVLTNLALEL